MPGDDELVREQTVRPSHHHVAQLRPQIEVLGAKDAVIKQYLRLWGARGRHGVDWDGEPVYQSQRLDLYEGVFRLLRDADPSPLYPCFCSRAEIRAASAPQEGDRFIIYPGTCRRLLAHDMAYALPMCMRPEGVGAKRPVIYGSDPTKVLYLRRR